MYNILICDDEKDIVSALSIYLSTENYKIFTAYTGREALDVVAHNDIHLILMDIMMPQMDGISATAKLRETCNIPIVLLTAKSEDSDKILAPMIISQSPSIPSKFWQGYVPSCAGTPLWAA